ncbi:MAG: 4-hydroxythreonine-4-phosphate dehydrogenase PdxA [Rhodospirillaceae bacterium]|nr:4-hydroxythreonine-4-phosphate dehydrogenase PdxA [Rhodospirillaceae bacterium]
MIPHLAITMGDPAGIGAEIIIKACERLKNRLINNSLRLLLIGSNLSLQTSCATLGKSLNIPEVKETDDNWPALAILHVGLKETIIYPGILSIDGGHFSYLAVEMAVKLALSGRIHGIVTAPLNKEVLNKAGYHFTGHTDMLAYLTGTRDSVMMLICDNMRVAHVTTHVAIQDVSAQITLKRLRYVIDITNQTLIELGLPRRRIAVASLNPHSGEGGLFGCQDIKVSSPVIANCTKDGLDVSGPISGDVVFVKLRAGLYDAVIAMYHDQGHIPFKLLSFNIDSATKTKIRGVNITLGLPIVRTSVDHGTAFDIAGKGIADETSLIEAIEYAEVLARARNII